MRYKVFLDTNILISGIFFEGNESEILDMVELDLITSEDVIDELKKITKKKLKYLGNRTLEIALLEVDRALFDIDILPRERYEGNILEAKKMITHKKGYSNIGRSTLCKCRLFNYRRFTLLYLQGKRCA